MMFQGNIIEVELDEFVYYFIKNQFEICCVDMFQYFNMKCQVFQVFFVGYIQLNVYFRYSFGYDRLFVFFLIVFLNLYVVFMFVFLMQYQYVFQIIGVMVIGEKSNVFGGVVGQFMSIGVVIVV